DLEQFRDGFAQILGVTPKAATVTTTVVVFKSEEALRAFGMLGSDGQPMASAGYFQAADDTDYIALVGGMPIPPRIYHRYTHELIKDLPAAVPLWFTEGLAEFFSNFEIVAKDKQFSVGKLIPEHVEALRKGKFPALDDLFAVNRSSAQYNERDVT